MLDLQAPPASEISPVHSLRTRDQLSQKLNLTYFDLKYVAALDNQLIIMKDHGGPLTLRADMLA